MRNSFLVAVVLGLLTLVVGVGPASAHAGLSGTDPEDGARLQSMPSTITFTFTENIGNAFVAVTAPDGTAVQVAEPDAVDRRVTASLADPEQRGTYSASYRVVSADGHPVAGTVTFDVTTGEQVTQVAAESSQGESEGFFDRHVNHVIWGGLAGIAALVLILLPLRRSNDAHSA